MVKWIIGSLLAIVTVIFVANLFIDLPVSDASRLREYRYNVNGIGYDTVHSLVDADIDGDFRNLKSLNLIVRALYKYENEHYAFPLSSKGGKSWSSPVRDGNVWIAALVPKYIRSLPEDANQATQFSRNFLYYSDGMDFKLIATGPNDCARVKEAYPQLVDPKRDCRAYGYWTEGAVAW